MTAFRMLQSWHGAVFGAIERAAAGWLLGLAARLVFAGVLFFYFFNSWKTKLGDGIAGLFVVSDNAYYQIVPWAVESASGDIGRIGPLDTAIVYAGTYAELLLPVLIVVGLFTRIAALGMILFIAVQSFVDIRFHGVDAQTVGAWFDRFPDAVIADQRALWVFLLLVLVVQGAGAISLDGFFRRSGAPARR